MQVKTKISIIGFGEVGSTLAALINTRFENVFFNLFDTSTELSGRILDFSNACAINKNEVFENDKQLLEESDFVFYCAGYSNKKGQSRNEVASNNYQLVQEIFRPLRLKSTAIVVVITNPVELVSRWVYEALFRSNLVIGTGTTLDTFRFNDTIADKENFNISEIKTLLLGEHGEKMVAVLSHSTINSKLISRQLSEEKIEYYLQLVQNSANKIRETENATKYGVSECALLILKGFLENKHIQTPLSVLQNNYYREKLIDLKETFISLPCQIKNGQLSVLDIELSEGEIEAMKNTLSHLDELHFEVIKSNDLV